MVESTAAEFVLQVQKRLVFPEFQVSNKISLSHTYIELKH